MFFIFPGGRDNVIVMELNRTTRDSSSWVGLVTDLSSFTTKPKVVHKVMARFVCSIDKAFDSAMMSRSSR